MCNSNMQRAIQMHSNVSWMHKTVRSRRVNMTSNTPLQISSNNGLNLSKITVVDVENSCNCHWTLTPSLKLIDLLSLSLTFLFATTCCHFGDGSFLVLLGYMSWVFWILWTFMHSCVFSHVQVFIIIIIVDHQCCLFRLCWLHYCDLLVISFSLLMVIIASAFIIDIDDDNIFDDMIDEWWRCLLILF